MKILLFLLAILLAAKNFIHTIFCRHIFKWLIVKIAGRRNCHSEPFAIWLRINYAKNLTRSVILNEVKNLMKPFASPGVTPKGILSATCYWTILLSECEAHMKEKLNFLNTKTYGKFPYVSHVYRVIRSPEAALS